MIELKDSIGELPYVGSVYLRRLERLGIRTIRDLLYHFPFRYRDFSHSCKIRELLPETEAAVQGTIIKAATVRSQRGKLLTKAAVADESGAIEAVWFNQPYLFRTIKEGSTIRLAGKVEEFGGRISFVSPEFELVRSDRPPTHTAGLVPVYPETAQLSSKWLRNRIQTVLSGETAIPEFIPETLLRQEKLLERKRALSSFHFPKSPTEVKSAQKRFAFEELFLFNLRSLRQRRIWEERPAAVQIPVERYQNPLARFIQDLPFILTAAQQRAVAEIIEDLEKSRPMNRLLEGDVGSGKTAVAAVEVYLNFLAGHKAVFMAPTEILADQHLQTLKKMLEPHGVRIAFHTGSRKTDTKDGDYDLWIGTHALFYRQKRFSKVGLVVIDEQHRFGVEQRAKLLEQSKSGAIPHLLTLTATPIPRTLALTVYGDLDISILDELPPGRRPPRTFAVPAEKREAGYRWVYERVRGGEQAFVICPLIEESKAETMQQVKSAKAEYELIKEKMPGINVGLLHGRLPAKEKAAVMRGFQSGETGVLVSTPVVEVGIDVPNATIMVIEAAERFGLASLHQLRGRVGRGSKESFCFLFASESNGNGSRKALGRLRYLEKNADGFKLAEFDLKQRGPGEIYGVKQHGLTELKVADLTDSANLKRAREAAQQVLRQDPNLDSSSELKQELSRFSDALVEPN